MELRFARFDEPDDVRRFDNGIFELITIGGMTLGRARYEPGWRWSVDVAPTAGTPTCQVEHLGYVVSGRTMAYVSIHFLGADGYAAAHD